MVGTASDEPFSTSTGTKRQRREGTPRGVESGARAWSCDAPNQLSVRR